MPPRWPPPAVQPMGELPSHYFTSLSFTTYVNNFAHEMGPPIAMLCINVVDHASAEASTQQCSLWVSFLACS